MTRDPEARAALAAEPQPDEAYPVLILADGKRDSSHTHFPRSRAGRRAADEAIE
jgi:hypothetical protein